MNHLVNKVVDVKQFKFYTWVVDGDREVVGNIIAEVKDKDRTNIHKRNEIIENPTLLDWEVLIERGKGKKDYVLANTLNEAVDEEENKYIKNDKDNSDIPNINNEKDTEKEIEELK